MNFLIIAGVLIVSYLLGSIPFGFLIGKFYGIDIRKVGSCNIGATNVTRSVGKKAGKLCFLLDLGKGFLPVFLAGRLFDLESMGYLPILAGAGTVAGHMFTIFLKFKGGKGVATAGGVILGMAPLTFAVCFGLWAVMFLVWRYVSLASIFASILLPFTAWLFNYLKWEKLNGYIIGFFAVLGLLSVLKHHANIKRLLNGTEAKFQKKS